VTEGQDLLQFVHTDRIWVAVVLIFVGWLTLKISGRVIDDLGESFTDRRLFFKKAKGLTRFALYATITLAVAMTVLNVGESLWAVLGAVGFGITFAFQDIISSLIAGVILLIDEPFQVGDRIRFGDHYGEVTDIGIRSVRLITLDDNLVTIPNNKFLQGAVASANAGELDCMVVIPFYIGAAEDFQNARRIVAEATTTSRYVYLNKPVVTHVRDEFLGERFVTVIRVKAYVFDARYESAFTTDVTERVKTAFAAAGLRAPDRQYRDLDLNMQETPPDKA
jgi:small conductance mechanosensitive channel